MPLIFSNVFSLIPKLYHKAHKKATATEITIAIVVFYKFFR